MGRNWRGVRLMPKQEPMGFFGFRERLEADANKPQDRRVAGRLNCERLRCNLGTMLDLSGGGARVQRPRFAKRYKPGDQIELRLMGDIGCLSTPAEVVWVVGAGIGRDIVGVRFAELSGETKHALNLIARDHTMPSAMRAA